MTAPHAPVALRVGDAMPAFRSEPVARTDIVRYAGAGGDFNPIHHDDEFARTAGFPGVFAMGFLQGGMLAQRLARWVGPWNVRSLRLRFTGQVWPGDVLELTARVAALDENTGPQPLATCELLASTNNAEVIRGEAIVAVARDSKG